MSLDLAEKGKTFDMTVNDLITFYQRYTKQYTQAHKKWEKGFKGWEKEFKQYESDKEVWNKLLKWAKLQGFKP